MKKVLGFLTLVITIIGQSNAYSQAYFNLKDIKELSPQNWQESYIDKYGREVDVDIEIQVFGENTAPILRLTYPNNSFISDEWDDVNARENNLFISISKNNPHRTISSGKMRKNEEKYVVYSLYCDKSENDRKYGREYGNDLTMNEVYGCLDMLLERLNISPESFMHNPLNKLEVLSKVNKDSGEYITPSFFSIELWRQYYGLPVLTHASSGFDKRGWPDYCPSVNFSISNSDEYQIIVRDLEEVEVIADDIPLCSVETVIESLKNEIEIGHIRKVFDIQLGYAVYNDPDFPKNSRSSHDAKCYYAVPSWVVNCIYITNPKNEYAYSGLDEEGYGERDSEEFRTLVINAQTGKLLDPQDKTKTGGGNADYKGYISWDEI